VGSDYGQDVGEGESSDAPFFELTDFNAKLFLIGSSIGIIAKI
jgi:hypothetical protein